MDGVPLPPPGEATRASVPRPRMRRFADPRPRRFVQALPHGALLLAADGRVVAANDTWLGAYAQAVDRPRPRLGDDFAAALESYAAAPTTPAHDRVVAERAASLTRAVLAGTEQRAEVVFAPDQDPAHQVRLVVERVALPGAAVLVSKQPVGTEDGRLLVLADLGARYERLASVGTDLVAVLDPDGTARWVGEGLPQALGWTAEQILGRNWLEIVHPDDVPTALVQLSDARLSRPVLLRVRGRDAGWRWLEIQVSDLRDDPAVAGLAVHAKDATARVHAEQALADTRERLALAFDTAAVAMTLLDGEGRILEANDAFALLVGREPDRLPGTPWMALLHPDDRSASVAVGAALLAGAGLATNDRRVLRADGSQLWARVTASPLRAADGTTGLFVHAWDVTEAREAALALAERESLLQAIVDSSSDAIVTADEHGRIELVNPAATELFGWPADELRGRPLTMLMPRHLRDVHTASLQRYVETGEARVLGQRRVEIEGQRRDGTAVPLELTVQEVSAGPRRLFAGTMRDITDRLQHERRLTHEATHDPLTGLPNRALLLERADQARARVAAGASPGLAVIFLDLDDFNVVNDSLGHRAGDALLVSVARRLEELLSPGFLLARMSGDEFVVLLDHVAAPEEAARVADRVQAALAHPFAVSGRLVSARASIGVAVSAGPAAAEQLLEEADTAMYAAKHSRRGSVRVFDSALRADARRRLEDEHDLRRAIAGGELVLHYQPVMSVASGGAVSVEALVRWQRPGRGLLGPAEFVGLAEETGLMGALGEVVLGQAVRQAAAWRQLLGEDAPRVAVNVSARQLDDDLSAIVGGVLEAADLPASSLTLEITESVLMERQARERLDPLRALGVRLAIDDFGTGYSSLAYLSELPVDVLKVDRRFVSGLPRRQDVAVLGAVVALARTLGLETVAEGVETPEQLAAVAAAGCTAVQGFLLSRPVPADILEQLLESGDLRAALHLGG